MSVELWSGVLAGLAGVHLAGRAYQAAGVERDRRQYPPPGALFDGVHMHVLGEGSPTVLFEAGLGASSLSWAPMQQRVSALTRTVSYDRLGLGWSDAPTARRRMPRLASEIVAGLNAAGIGGPLVVVGHSFGGYLARFLAAAQPRRVAALVLVDPLERREFCPLSRRDEFQLRRGAILAEIAAELCEWGFVRLALEGVLKGSHLLPRLMKRGANHNSRGSEFASNLVDELRKLPRSAWPVIKSHWCVAKNLRVMADYFAAMPEQCSNPPDDGVLSDLPLWVISTSTTPAARLAGHRETAALSSRGRHLVAGESGHWVQLDQPDLLAEVIQEAVAAARSSAPAPEIESQAEEASERALAAAAFYGAGGTERRCAGLLAGARGGRSVGRLKGGRDWAVAARFCADMMRAARQNGARLRVSQRQGVRLTIFFSAMLQQGL